MRALDGAVGSPGGATAASYPTGPVTISPVVKADFTGARFTSDTDIEKMLDRMAEKMEEVAMRATKRAIGNRRT